MNISFENLLKPLTLQEFLSEYWNKKHCHLQVNGATAHHHLLTLAHFDHIIATQVHQPIRLIKERQTLPPHLYAQGEDKEAMVKFFNEGYTIVYQHLNKSWEALRQLCYSVANELSIAKKVYANVYFTPASSQALKRHSDWQDVFVLQIHGEKRWQLFENDYKYPINNEQTQQMVSALEQAAPVADLLLKPGDLLYVPRGLAHEVHTLDKNSLHISLTVETFSKYDVMAEALKQAADTQSDLRDNIPLDFFEKPSVYLSEMFENLVKNTQFNLPIHSKKHLSGANHNTHLKGFFIDQEKAENISANDELVLRRHLSIDFIPQGTAYVIATSQYQFKVEDANEEIEFIKKGEKFTLNSLPGDLDQEDKQALVEMLVQTGILTFV